MVDFAGENAFLDELSAFLCRPDIEQLFLIHPNQAVVVGFTPPMAWAHWWEWAGEESQFEDTKWEFLWKYYTTPEAYTKQEMFQSIPAGLRALIDDARRLQLTRVIGTDASIPQGAFSAVFQEANAPNIPIPEDVPYSTLSGSQKMRGMSPKKAHEVRRMADYTSRLLSSMYSRGISIRHAVDVGAGQAYLSRALRDDLGINLLALDWSSVQTEGAVRREQTNKPTPKSSQDNEISSHTTAVQNLGTLTYRTLAIDAQSLLAATDEWISQERAESIDEDIKPDRQLPVIFVALHACGSLTLNVLRAYLQRLKAPQSSGGVLWKPVAAVVVGCCYNLLDIKDRTMLTQRDVTLSANHLQLAAQVPSQWNRKPGSWLDAKLAIRKVAWRALLEKVLVQNFNMREILVSDGIGGAKRLGRLNDNAYKSWETFVDTAQKKFNVIVADGVRDKVMESRLEVLQLLRCILGPVVESLLLLDRKVWLRHELRDTGMDMRFINLFERKSGSARNVAIILGPRECQ